MLTVIIDGNNVLETLHLGRGASLEAAESFMQRLETAAVKKDWEIMMVFDGRPRFLPRETGPLIVQYAPPRQTADALIERMVYQAQDRSICAVVTRDRAQADLVLGLGGRVWSPKHLLEELSAE